jgi:hypothetical protein
MSNATPCADRLAIINASKPKRISSYGSHPWAIVHESGNVLMGPPEVIDYGLGPRQVNGPSYFARKRDAQAALVALKRLLSSSSTANQE